MTPSSVVAMTAASTWSRSPAVSRPTRNRRAVSGGCAVTVPVTVGAAARRAPGTSSPRAGSSRRDLTGVALLPVDEEDPVDDGRDRAGVGPDGADPADLGLAAAGGADPVQGPEEHAPPAALADQRGADAHRPDPAGPGAVPAAEGRDPLVVASDQQPVPREAPRHLGAP